MSALAGNSDRVGRARCCPAGAIVLIQAALGTKRNVVLRYRITGPPLLGIARRIWYIELPRATLDPCAAAKKLMSLRQFTEQLNDQTPNNQEADSSS
jgi:hypothetical protein